MLVQGDSVVDKKCKEVYEDYFRAHIKLGVKCAPLSNTIICGDIIVETFIPKKLIDLQEKVYNSSTNRFDLNWIESYTRLCYFDKYKINATISRNKELAEQLKENVMKYFQ